MGAQQLGHALEDGADLAAVAFLVMRDQPLLGVELGDDPCDTDEARG